MRVLRASVTSLVLLLATSVAHGQEEVCNEDVRQADWIEAMDAIDAAIASGNGVLAGNIVADISHVLRCAVEVVPPADLGRLARQRSVLGFYEQDDLETERWARLARLVVGWADWPDSLQVAPAYHDVIDGLEPAATSGPTDQGLAPPRGGAILLDGRLITRPRASVEVPHLVQVLDKKGRVMSTHWQDGAVFDEALLGPPDEAPTPRWYEAPPPPVPKPVVPSSRPPVAAAPVDQGPGPRVLTFDMGQIGMVCQWRGDPRDIEIDKERIAVNGQIFRIDDDTMRREYKDALRICGEFRAVRHFERWQQAKRSLFSFGANKHKARMRNALLTREPVVREEDGP